MNRVNVCSIGSSFRRTIVRFSPGSAENEETLNRTFLSTSVKVWFSVALGERYTGSDGRSCGPTAGGPVDVEMPAESEKRRAAMVNRSRAERVGRRDLARCVAITNPGGPTRRPA